MEGMALVMVIVFRNLLPYLLITKLYSAIQTSIVLTLSHTIPFIFFFLNVSVIYMLTEAFCFSQAFSDIRPLLLSRCGDLNLAKIQRNTLHI